MPLSTDEKEKFQKISESIWERLNEKGKRLDELEKNKEKRLKEIKQQEFWDKPVWHNKTDMDIFVAKKINVDQYKWDKDKSRSRFYKKIAGGISQLRKEGKIVDWRPKSRTGVWRLSSTKNESFSQNLHSKR